MAKNEKVSVFNYTDYRLFLEDYYKYMKATKPGFSYRYFAQRAGYNSSGVYKDIVSGRTGIKTGFIHKISRAIKFHKKEAEYFENMVLYNQAKTLDEKNTYFERMMRFRDSKAYIVDAAQYEYYSKWYYTAVRDLLSIANFGDDFQGIAKALSPAIRPDQAKKAIEILKKIGFIKKDSAGHYKAVNKIISTGDDVASLNVKNFQKEMMELAKQALDRHNADRRNISTVSFSIAPKDFESIQAELVSCRKRILNIVERSVGEDRLYQLNLQLFPLSQIKE